MNQHKSRLSGTGPADAGDAFVAETEAFVRAGELLGAGQAVVVGVSGGADSVALAAALVSAGRYQPHVAHVHHGLRADADEDAEFVADMARKWSVPFQAERIDTPALAERWGVGIEEAARRGRYEVLADVAERIGAGAVAVAHNSGDQVETILHRLIRGTHLRGLVGMRPKRRLRGSIDLIRPLLWAPRERIEQFCRSAGLSWRTDRTNAATEFTRNFIRRELLPMLRGRLNVRVDEALLRLASAAGEAEEVLDDLAGDLYRRAFRKRSEAELLLRAAPLKKAPPLLASMAVRAALAELGAPEQELTRERFDDLLAVVGGALPAVDLPGGFRAERRGQSIRLFRSSVSDEPGV